ncbi:MAG: hypothetical protein SOI26_05325 [Coriobacteriales bacterium]|jgi:NAD+ synthase (glutamine-hydrolysing)
MRVALAQLDSNAGDFPATVDGMLRASDRARDLGADLVVFPSTTLSPVDPAELDYPATYMMDMLDALEGFAASCDVCALVPAFVDDGDGGYFDVFFCEGGAAGPLRLREARRARGGSVDPARMPARVRVGGVTVRVAVVPDEGEGLPDDGDSADLTVVCAAVPYRADFPASLLAAGLGDPRLRAMLRELPGWVAVLQGVGACDETVLAGGSFAVSPERAVVAACPCFEEEVVTFDVEPPAGGVAASGEARGLAGGARAREPRADVMANSPLSVPVRPVAGIAVPARPGMGPSVGMRVDEAGPLRPSDATRLLWDALRVAVRDFCEKVGAPEAVVGLAGDLGSSVTLALAVDALGPGRVTGVLAPTPGEGEDPLRGAVVDQARGLGVEVVDVGPLADPHMARDRRDADAPGARDPRGARERSYARAAALAAFADRSGALVLGACDKTARALGVAGPFADVAQSYCPLSDLYRSQVAALAAWLRAEGRAPAVPEPLVARARNVLIPPPTPCPRDSLRPPVAFGDDVSDGVGGTLTVGVPDVDGFLEAYLGGGMDAPRAVGCSRLPERVARRVLDLFRRAALARSCAPLGPAVSSTPLSGLWWPVSCGWRDSVRRRGYDGTSVADQLGRALGIRLGPSEPAEGERPARGSLGSRDGSPATGNPAPGREEGPEGTEDPEARGGRVAPFWQARGATPSERALRDSLASRLDDMVARISHQDQVVGMIGDVAFGERMSGHGPDMDTLMGMPLFSKN